MRSPLLLTVAALLFTTSGCHHTQKPAPASGAADPNEPMMLYCGHGPGKGVRELQPEIAWLRQGLWTALRGFEHKIRTSDVEPPLHELMDATLTMYALGRSDMDPEGLLEHAWRGQDLDTASPTYGTVPRTAHQLDAHDVNDVQLALHALGPLLKRYGSCLSRTVQTDLRMRLPAALHVVSAQDVLVTRTAGYLVKATNLILVGEIVGDKAAADEGYAELDRWLQYTRQNGIAEFDSPGGYAVDLDSLTMGALFAGRPEGKDRYIQSLDVFWRDIASNYFAPRGSLSGPQTHEANPLSDHGTVEIAAFIAELRDVPPDHKVDLSRVFELQNALDDGYQPDSDLLGLAGSDRFVESKVGANGLVRTNYVTRAFSIGGISSRGGGTDKPVTIALAGPPDMPLVSLSVDDDDHPYAHEKSRHLASNPVTVQDHGLLLATLAPSPNKKNTEVTGLVTNVVLPSRVDAVVVSGQPVNLTQSGTHPLASGAVIALRLGGSALAIRVLEAQDCSGHPITPSLVSDDEGVKLGVARLVLDQGGAGAIPESCKAPAALLFLVRQVKSQAEFDKLSADLQAAVVDDRHEGDAWTVAAQVGGTKLTIGRDVEHRKILGRLVNDRAAEPTAALVVNGVDELLSIGK